MVAPHLKPPQPRKHGASALLAQPVASANAIRAGGGRPAPSDTVPARLTPGETVIPKQLSEGALAPLVAIFEKQGHITQRDVEKYLYPILQNLEAEGGEQGFADGGVVAAIKNLFVNPNIARTRAEIQQMKDGTYQTPTLDEPEKQPQARPVYRVKPEDKGERGQAQSGAVSTVEGAANLLRSRGRMIDDAVDKAVGYDNGGVVTAQGMVNGQPDYGYGKRYGSNDQKGIGFYGPIALQGPMQNNFATEKSVGIDIAGKNVEVPSIVPGLSAAELHTIVNNNDMKEWPESVWDKISNHARQRMLEGKNVFAGPQDKTQPIPQEESKGAVGGYACGGKAGYSDGGLIKGFDEGGGVPDPNKKDLNDINNWRVSDYRNAVGFGNSKPATVADSPAAPVVRVDAKNVAELGKQFENDPYFGLRGLIPGLAQQSSVMKMPVSAPATQPAAAQQPTVVAEQARPPEPPATATQRTIPRYGPNGLMSDPVNPVTPQAETVTPGTTATNSPAPQTLVVNPNDAQAGPPSLLQGSATGQVFNQDQGTSLGTHPETRQYVQGPGGNVMRADGKPMGGSFNVLGSVTDPATGQKAVAAPGGGTFTYDKDGKLTDYSSPLTQEADRKAQQYGYADRKDYLAQMSGGGGRPAGALMGDPAQKMLLDRIDTFRSKHGVARDPLTKQELADITALGNVLGNVSGHQLLANVGHERNAVESEANRERARTGRQGEGREQINQLQASMLQQIQAETDPATQQAMLQKYRMMFGDNTTEKTPNEFSMIPDPDFVPDPNHPLQEWPKIPVTINKQTSQAQRVAVQGNNNAGKALPKIGDVVKGHRYKGGDPSKPESWEKV